MEALVSPAFYVGALGSRANNAKRRARLAGLALPPEAIARLHGPVGLPIGSRSPAEIAVAILAELTAVPERDCAACGEPGAACGFLRLTWWDVKNMRRVVVFSWRREVAAVSVRTSCWHHWRMARHLPSPRPARCPYR